MAGSAGTTPHLWPSVADRVRLEQLVAGVEYVCFHWFGIVVLPLEVQLWDIAGRTRASEWRNAHDAAVTISGWSQLAAATPREFLTRALYFTAPPWLPRHD
jgi:hypothetical protein